MNNLNRLIIKGETESVTHTHHTHTYTHTKNLFLKKKKNSTNKILELDDFMAELYIHIKFAILYILQYYYNFCSLATLQSYFKTCIQFTPYENFTARNLDGYFPQFLPSL